MKSLNKYSRKKRLTKSVIKKMQVTQTSTSHGSLEEKIEVKRRKAKKQYQALSDPQW